MLLGVDITFLVVEFELSRLPFFLLEPKLTILCFARFTRSLPREDGEGVNIGAAKFSDTDFWPLEAFVDFIK